jgi:hypothetical protein
MDVSQGPNWDCSAKEKKKVVLTLSQSALILSNATYYEYKLLIGFVSSFKH